MSDSTDNAASAATESSQPSENGGSKPDLDPALEKQLREAAEAEERFIQDITDNCQKEFNKRSSMLTDQFNVSFKSQMSNLGERYTSQLQQSVTTKQTDVLKVNKIIRDVSRDLGADWKPVFLRLLKGEDEGKVKVEVARIERQKPFMQAFKALNTWKDMLGERFDIRLLSETLIAVNRHDLAEKVLDILDNNELDSLYAMDAVGKGITSSRQPPPQSANTESDTKTESSTTPRPTMPTEDPVGDRILVKIAKAVDKDWEPLAQALNVSEEEIQDTQESSGATYHGGFKILYTWRDDLIEAGKSTPEMVDALKQALEKIGKAELSSNIPS